VLTTDKKRIVYRAFRNKSWVDRDNNDEILPLAFKLRDTEEGLSIILTKSCPSREKCKEITKLTTYGVAGLNAGDIYELHLFIVEFGQEEHGEIQGVPRESDDEQAALDIATGLARIAYCAAKWEKY
jgi:hypothetical protein